jgi:hypothetical protein
LLPEDDALRGLAAARGGGVEALLGALGLPGPARPLKLLLHHPGRRCTFRAGPYAVKAYADEPEHALLVAAELERNGLASGSPPTAAPLIAMSSELRVLVTRWLEGPDGRTLLARGRGQRLGLLAAQWLEAMRSRPLALPAGMSGRFLAAKASRWLRHIVGADPSLGDQARACVSSLTETAAVAQVPTHGQFTATHVIDLGGGPGVIDWDNGHAGSPDADVWKFVSSLDDLAADDPSLAAQSAAAASAFLAHAAEPRDAARYESARLLKAANTLARLRPSGWRADMAVLVTAAAELICSPH